jgi:hypothetical protein
MSTDSRQPARIVIMTVGPVPIVRMQVREVPGDRVVGSFVCSDNLAADIARARRGAERRGYVIVGEIAHERSGQRQRPGTAGGCPET